MESVNIIKPHKSSVMKSILKFLSDQINKPLPSIFIREVFIKRTKISGGRWVHSLKEGDQVLIEDGKLVDCHDMPTHVVTCLFSKYNQHYSISVMNIKTMEFKLIQL